MTECFTLLVTYHRHSHRQRMSYRNRIRETVTRGGVESGKSVVRMRILGITGGAHGPSGSRAAHIESLDVYSSTIIYCRNLHLLLPTITC